jgi:pyruvate kinase
VSGDDVRLTKRLLKEAGSEAGVISKIERAESLVDEVINDIIQESAGIMVARGDLGVEIGDPQLPAQQKRLIKLARSNDRIVITATQMLESMINSPIPTRAEVFDLANLIKRFCCAGNCGSPISMPKSPRATIMPADS